MFSKNYLKLAGFSLVDRDHRNYNVAKNRYFGPSRYRIDVGHRPGGTRDLQLAESQNQSHSRATDRPKTAVDERTRSWDTGKEI